MGRSRGYQPRYARLVVAMVGVAAIALAGVTSTVAQSVPDTLAKTTVQQRILPDAAAGFHQLQAGPGESYVVRQEGVGTAKAGRANRRVSLVYFGELTDFQLADEESPARVEVLDRLNSALESAWRPSEILNPQIDDAAIRQINAFAAASPLTAGDGSRRAMDLTLNTGDSADNQQLNETEWVRILMEGGMLDPNSGIDPTGYVHQLCPPLGVPGAAEAARYTGVADYDDYVEGPNPLFYDPDDPRGEYAGWPAYPGLADNAQKPFLAAGLDVPSYVTFGNHDALAQGNEDMNRAFEDIATGCIKPLAPTADPSDLAALFASLTPANLLAMLAGNPANVALVPPDPRRQAVSKKQYIDVFRSGTQADGHGFDFIDPAQEAASNGAAGYYSFSPLPGMRFISIDTTSEGGVVGISSDGNVDDPQFKWLEKVLVNATARDELVVLFSHHAIQSLSADIPDEAASPCTAPDAHGHDQNPGCDLDPRTSTPVHLGDDLTALVHRYPHVIAWIAGHSHVNDVTPFPDGKGGGFWMIRTAAEADWPQQSRLVEIFDNKDGTLSIFGTVLDHASNVTAPAPGTDTSTLDTLDLASIGRTLSANDPQKGVGTGEGQANDRNVELLVADPRSSPGGGGNCARRQLGSRRADHLRGTAGGDRLIGLGGRDRLDGFAGKDCLLGGPGADTANGGPGVDKLRGQRGRDRLRGGPGADRIDGNGGWDRLRGAAGRDVLRGGIGNDVINSANDGSRDVIDCGPGPADRAIADPRERVRRCERVRRVG